MKSAVDQVGRGRTARAALGLAVGAALLGAGCGSAPPPAGPPVIDMRPTTVAGFETSRAHLACLVSVRCGDGSSPSCHPWADQRDPALYELDAAAAASCLDAIAAEALSCATATTIGAGIEALCDAALRGRVAVGSDCLADANACVPGASCLGTVCSMPAAAGGACVASIGCADGLACIDSLCTPPSDVGGPCEDTADCVGTALCERMVCVARGAEGAACRDGTCLAGLYCDGGICAPELATGTECTTDAECGVVAGDVIRPCLDTADDTTRRCRVYGNAAGEACIPDYDRDGLEPFCGPGLVCVRMRTIGVTQVGVCVPGRTVGDACDDIHACVHGARCVDRVCVALAGQGEACGGGVACAAWQDCRGGRCAPAPRPGEACTTSCAAGVCQNGTCCLEALGTLCSATPGDPCDGICLDGRCQRFETCSCGAGQGCYTDLGTDMTSCGPLCD